MLFNLCIASVQVAAPAGMQDVFTSLSRYRYWRLCGSSAWMVFLGACWPKRTITALVCDEPCGK